MKKLLTFSILLLFFCQLKVRSQTAFPDTDSLINYLSGNWTWYRSCGGFNGGCTYATQVNTQQFTFNRIATTTDSIAYKYYKNGALNSQGRSKLFYGSSLFGVTWNMSQIPNFSAAMIAIPSANADTVLFADNCNDCYTHTYVRGGTIHTVGLREFSDNAGTLAIYPNPGTDRIKLTTGNSADITGVYIYDLNGKRSDAVSYKNDVADVSALSPGVYFIEVKTGNSTYRSKIIKE